MAHGFASPIEALDQIKECLGSWPVDGTIVHVGSDGSGLGIDCCPALVRIEDQVIVPTTVVNSLAAIGKNCKPVAMTVAILYRECWVAQDNTPGGKPAAEYEVVGRNLVITGWEKLELLSCCKPYNQLLRFVELRQHPGDGSCVGWDLIVEADVSFCGCSPTPAPVE